jgi:hypothetical protein
MFRQNSTRPDRETTGDTRAIMMRKFASLPDLALRFADIFRGPSFLMTLIRIKPKFREKILLAVTVTNNCFG